MKSAGMNGINRLLTRRDKDKGEKSSSSQHSSKSTDSKARPKSADSILALFRYPYDGKPIDEKKDKEEVKKIQKILQRLRDLKYENFDEAQVEFGLRTDYAAGNEDRAFDILVLFRQSIDGIVMPYDSDIQMLGAQNVKGVTCYLDSLLFAMFARLENFQPMLYTSFEDEPRRRLSTLIRIWVNMLRTGKLIHSDITKYLQEALAACGWKEANAARQQDTSEAFQFITEQLQLPLLTLKTELFHVGAEDVTGDHKLVEERLLDVAVLPDREDGRAIQLEDCLEEYFNNRVEVRRLLKRSNTTKHSQSEKPCQHSQLRVTEVQSGSTTPDGQDCLGSLPPATFVDNSEDQDEPSSPKPRARAPSIIKRTFSFDGSCCDMEAELETGEVVHMPRKGSRQRKEVQIPAWAMSSLIPFYTADKPTNNSLTNDAQVAWHLTSFRPVLGICLKRYAVLENGETIRRDALIDIPLQIAFPHFIQQEDESMFGNFKICLQSVICHRGTSVHSGHYICLIRGSRKPVEQDNTLDRQLSNSSSPPEYYEDPWYKFDDLAHERVTQVDIHQALKEEMPYLLFYQIQPLLEDTLPDIAEEDKPPTYTYSDSGVEMAIQEASPRQEMAREEDNREPGYFDSTAQLIPPNPNRTSFSDDPDQQRRCLNLTAACSRRTSLAVTDESLGSRAPSFVASATITPAEEAPVTLRASRKSEDESGTGSRLSRAANKIRGQHSRSTSAVGIDQRLSFSFRRKRSKDELSQPYDRNSSVHTLGISDGVTEDAGDESFSYSGDLPSKRSKKGKSKEKNKSSPEKDRSNGFSKVLLRDTDRDGNERECIIM